MIAQPGRRYAQIVNGRCHWKFARNELPVWADDAFGVVDVTDLAVEPNEGDLFDGAAFSKPVAPPLPTRDEVESEGRQQLASRFNRALVMWLAQRFGIPPAQAVQEISTIYRNLP